MASIIDLLSDPIAAMVTDHVGDTSREITLIVGEPTCRYQWTLETDPEWITEGLWAWGPPTGQGGQGSGSFCMGFPDPTTGVPPGGNVYGYNLDGNYENYLPETNLTSHAIDCRNLVDVQLKYWRWLNVDSPDMEDYASVQVSSDGSSWTGDAFRSH